MKPSHEDNRLAVQIALNAVQAFFQITIGFSAVLIGYYQFALKDVPGTQFTTFILIIASGLFAMISMICGFNAMSKAYKRVDGREEVGNNEDIWSTKALAGWIGAQSSSGLFALILFFVAVLIPVDKSGNKEKKIGSASNVDSLYIRINKGTFNIRKNDLNLTLPLATNDVTPIANSRCKHHNVSSSKHK